MSADALLKAVLVNPDDDLPRLVYADWLDEHGDHARAEFIRTQMELAKLPDHDPRYRALEDREHELLSEHEAGWLGEGTVGVREWEWRRGFIDEIAATCGQLANSRYEPTAAHPVKCIRCVGWGAGDNSGPTDWITRRWVDTVCSFAVGGADASYDGLACFFTEAELTRLTDLDMTTDGGWMPVCEILRLSRVRERLRLLRLGGRTGGEPVDAPLNISQFVRLISGAPLEHLACFDAGITSDGLRTLLSTPFAGTLKHLDVSDNPIAPDAYRAFQHCHPPLRLDKLDVSGTPLAGISLEPLLNSRSLESLTRLEMNGCGSARRNMEVLSRSAFWTQATELRAHSGTIPASTLEPLCRSAGPPGLRLLDLADNSLRTEGVRMLCESPWVVSLTWLALSRNYLDNESCEVLAKSGRFTNLRTLHLAHNHFNQEGADGEQITSRGVMALAESPSLANLRLLTLSYTGIKVESIAAVLDYATWRLSGLGVAGCDLSHVAMYALGRSPRLARLNWLDVSDNPRLGGQALRPLAESPYLSPLCELDCGGIAIDDDVRAIFRERLGPRFSH